MKIPIINLIVSVHLLNWRIILRTLIVIPVYFYGRILSRVLVSRLVAQQWTGVLSDEIRKLLQYIRSDVMIKLRIGLADLLIAESHMIELA